MLMRSFTFALASAVLVSIAACGGDDGGGGGQTTGASSPTSPSKGGSSESSSSESSSESSSSTESSSSSTSSGSKVLGQDCTASAECAENKCVLFTDNDGKRRGFCSRACTKAEDCPESGWECNISPWTACVPQRGD